MPEGIVLLLVGLLMAIAPAGVVRDFRRVCSVMRTLDYRIRGEAWFAHVDRPDDSPVSEEVKFRVRLGGGALCLLTIALIAVR